MVETTAAAALTTVSGKFYVGMTREEAKTKDLYKSALSRDFTDIDKDGNGVLDESEICNERDFECSRVKKRGIVSIIGTTVSAGVSIMVAPAAAVPITATGSSINAMIAAKMKDGEREQKLTDNYRKEHHLDTKV